MEEVCDMLDDEIIGVTVRPLGSDTILAVGDEQVVLSKPQVARLISLLTMSAIMGSGDQP